MIKSVFVKIPVSSSSTHPNQILRSTFDRHMAVLETNIHKLQLKSELFQICNEETHCCKARRCRPHRNVGCLHWGPSQQCHERLCKIQGGVQEKGKGKTEKCSEEDWNRGGPGNKRRVGGRSSTTFFSTQSFSNMSSQEKESWEDDVVESWDQLEVEQMPVPQKVEQELANLKLSTKWRNRSTFYSWRTDRLRRPKITSD